MRAMAVHLTCPHGGAIDPLTTKATLLSLPRTEPTHRPNHLKHPAQTRNGMRYGPPDPFLDHFTPIFLATKFIQLLITKLYLRMEIN
jgi:hypothetical protein